jgi:hypothetical protein
VSDSTDPQPTLRVVTPDATAEEIAALVAVLSTLGSPTSAPAPAGRQTSQWAAPHRAVRVRYSHGPGGWLASGLPR